MLILQKSPEKFNYHILIGFIIRSKSKTPHATRYNYCIYGIILTEEKRVRGAEYNGQVTLDVSYLEQTIDLFKNSSKNVTYPFFTRNYSYRHEAS